MFKSQKTYILLSLSLLLLNSFANAQTYCDPNNRPDPSTCFTQGFDGGVCAYYEEDCPQEICGNFVYNACTACSDSNVLYYKAGNCQPEEVVQKCDLDSCEDFENIYDPACGLRKGEDDETIFKTFKNLCELCAEDSLFVHYQPGVCEDDRRYCGAGKKHCGKKPVCAFLDIEGFETPFVTVESSSKACADPSVEYWTKGECGPLIEDRTYCLPNSRPDICPPVEDPVCGYYKDAEDNIAFRVEPNGCTACSNSDIFFHIPGACVFQCDYDSETQYECSGLLDPVCGTFIENGQEVSVSLRNACAGCYYSGKTLIRYSAGLCPGNQGIRCENNGDVDTSEDEAVCGYSTETCNDSSCQQTFDNPVVACDGTNTIWYSIGACS